MCLIGNNSAHFPAPCIGAAILSYGGRDYVYYELPSLPAFAMVQGEMDCWLSGAVSYRGN